ncbi:EcoRV family type II restriction endonuclease [Winogradskyella luteola]|uniref:EcoRV family type II restriction endonuclease n=1 Tax=Winogradskyella luteola TaxID=2828330 RepID=A0A9X1FB10_9FLAO|nr:EcoRV family type II restriction endonuclease [Winogradskyella luteola]MBV7270537.1 EcoRV family type II restriction endonuclease [Winogradskyella luteola]
MSDIKKIFLDKLKDFSKELTEYVSDKVGGWKVKGFIDTEKSIYTISSDTKIISKILEIQLFPKFREFADQNGYDIVLAEMQNWYPDLSFVSKENPKIKFAVDIKTTYRLEDYDGFCNGFTLGSHGEYFRERTSAKNIQFPYSEYTSHICLGILYTRALSADIDETRILQLNKLDEITSVIKDFVFFAEEKWKISSDKSGSGNTANIGSIRFIDDILKGNGVFKNLGEKWFDEYWIDHGKIDQKDEKGKPILTPKGKIKKITSLKTYLKYRGEDISKIYPVRPKRKNKKK